MIVLKQSTGMQKFRAEIKINGDINDYASTKILEMVL